MLFEAENKYNVCAAFVDSEAKALSHCGENLDQDAQPEEASKDQDPACVLQRLESQLAIVHVGREKSNSCASSDAVLAGSEDCVVTGL